jgi:hypothetical protein
LPGRAGYSHTGAIQGELSLGRDWRFPPDQRLRMTFLFFVLFSVFDREQRKRKWKRRIPT